MSSSSLVSRPCTNAALRVPITCSRSAWEARRSPRPRPCAAAISSPGPAITAPPHQRDAGKRNAATHPPAIPAAARPGIRWGWWCRCGRRACARPGRQVRAAPAATLRPVYTDGDDGRAGPGCIRRWGRRGPRGGCGPGRSGRRAGGSPARCRWRCGPGSGAGQLAAGVVAGLGVGVVARAAGHRGQRGRQQGGPGPPGGPVPGGGCRPGRQPCAAAVPSGLRAVRHQRVRGWRAAAAARSRASSPSRGPNPSASPGASERRCQVASGMVRVTSAARLGPDAWPGPGAAPCPGRRGRGPGRRDRGPGPPGRRDHRSGRVRRSAAAGAGPRGTPGHRGGAARAVLPGSPPAAGAGSAGQVAAVALLQQVQIGADAQLLHGAGDPGGAQVQGPLLDMLPGRENLREGQDGIARPIKAGDVRAVEGDLFLQRAADSLDHVALDLVSHAVGIDNLPASWTTAKCLTRISPLLRFTSTSATAPT